MPTNNNISNNPSHIAEYAPRSWVLWRHKDGKKPPCDLDGRIITRGTISPETAAKKYTLSEVQDARSRGVGDGFGVYLTPPLFGVDLDDVVTRADDGTVVLTHDALAIISKLATYTEVSPSGTGVKLFMVYRGTRPQDHTDVPLPSGGKIEIHPGASLRYYTVTGQHLEGTPRKLRTITDDDVAWLYDTYPKAPRTSKPKAPPLAPSTPSPSTSKPPTPEEERLKIRLSRWVATSWPKTVLQAVETLQSADGGYHTARLKNGHNLGASLRAVELACAQLGVPPTTIPAPNTTEAIARVLYEAKTPAKGSQRSELRTICDGVEAGYNKTTSPAGYVGNAPGLHDILRSWHDRQSPPTGTTTRHTPVDDDGVVFDDVEAVASGGDTINFDDIITPHSDITEKLKERVRSTRGQLATSDLYATAADVAGKAHLLPHPIVESTANQQHLLMPGVCQLAAGSKAGKSTIALHFAYCVAVGAGEVFGSPLYRVPVGGRVVYFDLENDASITGRRMADSFVETPSNLHFVTPEYWHAVLGVAHSQRVDRWRAMQWYITDTLRRFSDTRLLILDNVLQFQPRRVAGQTPEDLEENYMMWLAGVAETYRGLCIMLIDHNTKAQATDNEATMMHKAQGTFRKQALLSGGVLTVYTAPKKDDAPEGALKLATTMRACENTAIIITRDPTRGHHVLANVERLQLTVQQRRVYNALKAGATSPSDVCTALPDMPESTIKDALKKMVAKSIIYTPRYGTYALTDTSYNPRSMVLPTRESDNEE